MAKNLEDSAAPEIVIVRRNAGDGDGPHKGGVWKIAYADFMTAMMAFFLVMWIIGSTDEKKLAELAKYFNPIKLTDSLATDKGLRNIDAGEGREVDAPKKPAAPEARKGQAHKPMGETSSGVIDPVQNDAAFKDPFAAPSSLAADKKSPRDRTASDLDPHRHQPQHGVHESVEPPAQREADAPSAPAREPEAVAAQIKSELDAAFKSLPGAGQNLEVAVTSDGVLLSVTDGWNFEMFAVGTARPRDGLSTAMQKISSVLINRPEQLAIRGHTDGRQYRTGGAGNWKLSADRAHMAYTMLVQFGVPDARFARIEGRADRDLKRANPLAPENRRIEILLLRAD
jgi:chemotaxis protein MotB